MASKMKVPVIVTSGHPNVFEQAEEAGFAYLQKPFALKSCWLWLRGFSEVIQAGLPIRPGTPANMAGQRGDLRSQRARKCLTSAAFSQLSSQPLRPVVHTEKSSRQDIA